MRSSSPLFFSAALVAAGLVEVGNAIAGSKGEHGHRHPRIGTRVGGETGIEPAIPPREGGMPSLLAMALLPLAGGMLQLPKPAVSLAVANDGLAATRQLSSTITRSISGDSAEQGHRSILLYCPTLGSAGFLPLGDILFGRRIKRRL